MKFTLFAAAFALVAGLTLASAQPAGAADNMMAWKERQALMKKMGGQVRGFKTLEKAADAVVPAQTILEVVAMLPEKFPAGSTGEDSRAKPEIWQNMDDFKGKLGALKGAAEKLLAAAQSGDLEATKAAAGAVGGACGGCHRTYRAPEKK